MAMVTGDESRRPAGPVSELVKMVSMELRDLIARRDQVANRIRDVRLAVEALQRFHRAGTEEQNLDRTDPAFRTNSPAIGRSHGERGAGHARPNNLKLRRACRIALLETNKAMSEQEIVERILRRESYSPGKQQLMRRELIRELQALEVQGELRRIYSGSTWLWKRVSE